MTFWLRYNRGNAGKRRSWDRAPWSNIQGFAGLTCLGFQLSKVVQLFQASKCACLVQFALSPSFLIGGLGKYVGW